MLNAQHVERYENFNGKCKVFNVNVKSETCQDLAAHMALPKPIIENTKQKVKQSIDQNSYVHCLSMHTESSFQFYQYKNRSHLTYRAL